MDRSARALGQISAVRIREDSRGDDAGQIFRQASTGALTWKEFADGLSSILALPIGLILLEPDMGQALTYIPLLAVVLFLSSVRMWIVAPFWWPASPARRWLTRWASRPEW